MPNRLVPEPVARRDFLSLAGIWASGLAIFGSLVGMARLTKPSVLPEEGKTIRLGFAADYPPGTETVIPKQKVLILSKEKGIAALSLICTHLGCIVSKVDQGFDCPCHGSKFGPEGQLLAGPAPRPLRWFEISLAVDGRLIVDSEKEVPPGSFFTV